MNLCSFRFSLRQDFLASWRTWGTNVCLRSSPCCRPSAGANSCGWSAGRWWKRSMCCLDVQIMTIVKVSKQLNANSCYYSLTKESVRLQISLTWAVVNTVINCWECAQACEPANLWEECPKCMRTMLWRVSGVCLYVLYVCVQSLQKKPVKPPPPQMAFTKAGVEVGHISRKQRTYQLLTVPYQSPPSHLYYK